MRCRREPMPQIIRGQETEKDFGRKRVSKACSSAMCFTVVHTGFPTAYMLVERLEKHGRYAKEPNE